MGAGRGEGESTNRNSYNLEKEINDRGNAQKETSPSSRGVGKKKQRTKHRMGRREGMKRGYVVGLSDSRRRKTPLLLWAARG